MIIKMLPLILITSKTIIIKKIIIILTKLKKLQVDINKTKL